MVDFQRFFDVCNPTRTLNLGNPEDQPYYIDFSAVRGSNIIRELERTIRFSSDRPTCQLFSGHIGCGKSTELLRLKAELEQQNFYVVYFESTQDLDMVDVEVTDILLAIARQVSESLERSQIFLQPKGFKEFLRKTVDFLQTPIELAGEAELAGLGKVSASSSGNLEFSLPVGIGKITARVKDSPNLRSRLRQYLEPRTNTILQAINDELLQPATQILKQQGKKGLVVIVDNLDRVEPRPSVSGKPQTEYLFIDRGEQLRNLKCHLVYTVPLMLLFSNSSEMLKNRLGGGMAPKVLPMVPVRYRTGGVEPEGMRLLRQMVLVRAFPELVQANDPSDAQFNAQFEERITKVFDSSETLDRLCWISGGHVRKLLALLYSCLRREDLPLNRRCVERVIQEYRDDLLLTIDDKEWEVILRVVQQQSLRGEEQFQALLPSMFFFEYWDQQGRWFGINPVLEETQQFQNWQKQMQSQ
ncbi:ATP-binding protein [Oscillatoria sp. FACHB-1407]|uniref:P-loop NTPase fold protein n=1 Tax=Oscillatoria sp. FACHB-1407 TaxID=2692847 RepID=UPI0016825075|nr:P-loop NTPase fold protein [Oscillatoria sp. FACHB-1407]MBD2459499.1 ATP-binding protein [Oscillatoria sp. FACHB-1407]